MPSRIRAANRQKDPQGTPQSMKVLTAVSSKHETFPVVAAKSLMCGRPDTLAETAYSAPSRTLIPPQAEH